MELEQREVTLFTAGKVYSGRIDIANQALRTIDIFNSSKAFWRDSAEKTFEDALLLYEAQLVIEGGVKLKEFPRLQVRLSEIVFFCDSLTSSGDENEKLRATTLKVKNKEKSSRVHLITRMRGDAFFCISGVFYGLFKSKSQQRYIPITQAKVVEILRTGERWNKSEIPIQNNFLGISTQHIEACTILPIEEAA